jgi:anti-sigma B factor antagonist
MKIKSKEVDGVSILEISGEMYGGPENMKLVEDLEALLTAGKKSAILDMSKVKWIASTGLGILVRCHAKFAQSGGNLRLCGVNERFLTLLQVTRMNSIFEVHANQDAAVTAAKA